MTNTNWNVLMPLIFYFIGVFVIGFYSMKFVSKASIHEGEENGFLSEYLAGGRDLGGFVLAMTLVTTYLSAGSFIGGPGAAYTFGMAWVFLAMTQMPTGYFTLAVLGKKFAIVARKINAVTITDFIRARYKNDALVILCSISIVAFFIAAMGAQWIGAARLIEGSVGIPYKIALVFFAITVLMYTTIGGFRAVALTDTLQGVIMTMGTIALFVATIHAGGGISNIIQKMHAINPGLITPYSIKEGFATKAWVTSFWILVGFSVVGLPSVGMRAMSYKDSKSLKNGIIYGTVVSMVLILGMHMIGAFGIVVVPGIGSGDLVVPTIATKLFPPWVAGIILAGPLAAVMSTVDSQLLIVVGAIVNDLYANYINPRIKNNAKGMAKVSFVSAIIVGILVFMTAFNPPTIMVWLNLYANAGLISTFIWPIILGLYWKRANTPGAFASIITGVGSYILFSKMWPRPLGMHTIGLPLILSFIVFFIVSLSTEKPSKEIIKTFWGV
ncbi:sodium/pantothenate symporter [Marinisporobacter balticus]|uniref:Sodium/pantothenate symporter n=1 Tax=Marinisporobacter balticus TaxID=2018667 RepID=A0A4R2KZM7_9FIRM|nr:sodium/pantothenate symporter [Marinisporobacter balticus]TCO79393.1 sodium/pantothenate symporter [Marinisporobacter balticus]